MFMRVYPIARAFLLPIFRRFIRGVDGIEHLPRRGPMVIAYDHRAALDGIFIASVFIPRLNMKMHFITNRASLPRWGRWWEELVVKRWGAAVVYDPDNPGACLPIAQRALGEGGVVAISPQGRLQDVDAYEESRGSRGRTGVARLALWTGAPVVPVSMDTIRETKRWKAIGNILRHPHRIRIRIGEPIRFPKMENGAIMYEKLREVTDTIMTALERLRFEG